MGEVSRVDYIPADHRHRPYLPLTVRWSISYAKDRRPYHYLWELRVGTDPNRRTLTHGVAPTNAAAYNHIQHSLHTLLTSGNGTSWYARERFHLPK